MGYASLKAAVADLERTRQLIRIEAEIDPHLEMAEIQRRVYQAQGPALLFTRPKDCRFLMACNLFGTMERTRYLFRDTLDTVRRLMELKIDPPSFFRQPWRYWKVPRAAWTMLPHYVRSAPVLERETQIDQLPKLQCWPRDGGPFITLPQVYTEHPLRPGWRHSNLGMYRVQLSGNQYQRNRQVGLHYQIHRGIGVHHAAALQSGKPLPVTIAVGGPPAMMISAVMPLPEDLLELAFAGALGGRRVRLVKHPGKSPFLGDADFNIIGTLDLQTQLPEGPFGDHLGYYAQVHDFPVLNVEKVVHRTDAIWPFTVVGRPPQEDSNFGALIHELTGPVIPTVIPGVKAVHAVDAAGVHPLLLAIGSERYVPYAKVRRPQELQTIAHAILGQGQLSLAKYLFIAAQEDDPALDIQDVSAFFRHILERANWETDLHFHTCTTIDTLDYTGTALNEGSKLVVAVAGPVQHQLSSQLPSSMQLPPGFSEPRLILPGLIVLRGAEYDREPKAAERLAESVKLDDPLNQFRLVVLVDDSDFASRSLNQFLWVTFTRSNPATDVHGVASFIQHKHWGCRGALMIDARRKPHHSWPLEEDPDVTRKVDDLAKRGGPLHGII